MNDNKIVYPDYKNSIVNLTSSILETYNVKPSHSELSLLKSEHLKNKNIILIILDGFGNNLYEKYSDEMLPNLKKYYLDKITSVFPSTTSAAITSILTGKTPLEHGAIGWTLYFKEFAKNIDFLPNWDSITSTVQAENKYNVLDYVGSTSIFEMIAKKNPEIGLFHLTEKSIWKSSNVLKASASAKIFPHKNSKQLFKKIAKIIKKKKNQNNFVYAYSTNPDHLEHRDGVFSNSVKNYLLEFDQLLGKFISKNKGSDTTIIITADHGLLDINKYHYTNEDIELFNTLILPTFPEPRFISFFVKQHKIDKFLTEFNKYEDDFILFSRSEFFKKKLLGRGKVHPKIDDFIGNFVAIAKSESAMKSIYMQNGKWKNEFKAHHAGLTAAEMYVPLFKIDL